MLLFLKCIVIGFAITIGVEIALGLCFAIGSVAKGVGRDETN